MKQHIERRGLVPMRMRAAVLPFPLLLRFLKQATEKKIRLTAAVAFAVSIAFATAAYLWSSFDSNLAFCVKWMAYYNPLLRLQDFIIGGCIGALYRTGAGRQTKTKVACIVGEAAILLVVALSFRRYATVDGKLFKSFKYTVLFIPTTACLIGLLAENGGALGKLLSSGLLVTIGNGSAYGFLIHYPIIRYCELFFQHRGINNPLLYSLAATAGTAIGIVLWTLITKKIRSLYGKKPSDRIATRG